MPFVITFDAANEPRSVLVYSLYTKIHNQLCQMDCFSPLVSLSTHSSPDQSILAQVLSFSVFIM